MHHILKRQCGFLNSIISLLKDVRPSEQPAGKLVAGILSFVNARMELKILSEGPYLQWQAVAYNEFRLPAAVQGVAGGQYHFRGLHAWAYLGGRYVADRVLEVDAVCPSWKVC